MKKLSLVFVLLGLAAVLSVGLVACGGGSNSSSSGESSGASGDSEGGTLRGSFTSSPDYMDPQLSFTAEGWNAMQDVYIPLLTFKHAEGSEGSQIIPGLAKEVPEISNDGKTYTLYLRQGLKYSNGKPVKASDFKNAVERVFLVNSGGSPLYTTIVGAEQFEKTKKGGISGITTDDKTGKIVINLTHRRGAARGVFEYELALPFVALVPQNTPDKDESANPPPGTGPYMITQNEPGRGWEYERNPYWAKDNGKQMTEIPSGHVDKIEIEVLKNESTQVNYVEQGKLDFMHDPPPADRYQEIKEKYEGTQFKVEPTISTYYFWMNTQQAPFNNLKVRQAVNYAVDPAALERIYSGQIEGTQQILPPGMPGYKKFELYPHNMAKAKELVEEANPTDKSITVWTDTDSPNNDAGTYYQNVLKELGFNVELKIINADNYFTVIGNKETPNLDTGFTDWFQDFPHPNDFFQTLLASSSIQPTNNQNYSYTSIPSLDKEIERLSENRLEAKEEGEYAELDEKYMKQAPWAPYGNRTLALFTSDKINTENVIWNPTFEADLTSFEFK